MRCGLAIRNRHCECCNKRCIIIRFLIDHQTHHRGQMMVLLRHACLPVPAVMYPIKEMQ
ncbi:DinB family protein [Lysinibacillus pakistanensis]